MKTCRYLIVLLLLASIITFAIGGCSNSVQEAGSSGDSESPKPAETSPSQNAENESKVIPAGTGAATLPVFMYHYFYNPDLGETSKDANWMNIHDFEAQLKYLTDNRYYFPTWDEVIAFIYGEAGLPEKSVVLTSDDGDPSFYSMAAPLAEKYRAKLTGFIITGVAYDGLIDPYISDYITFESHSHDMHRAGSDGDGRILTATPEEIAADVQGGFDYLGKKDVYCYPFGDTNEAAEAALKANGVKLAFTTQSGPCAPNMDPLSLPRMRMSEGTSLASFIAMLGN
ncbi:MAG: polysaccharide deacetylase family protein [Clostridiales Family XIII bacterium]|jgi:peptidoglycan/xylan/chitin deacetylase (PgdA/CDA1 family)|nr:polysaccharide deacetylase family protein [Clostridiales Family XIII bacterium]